MGRYALVCLVVVALLTGCVVPQNIYADDNEDEIENPEAWLSEEEKAFVDSFMYQYNEVNNILLHLRHLMANPNVIDEAWFNDISNYAGSSTACGFSNVPAKMQDIAEHWENLVCAKLPSIQNAVNSKSRPRLGDDKYFIEISIWCEMINGLIDDVEAGMITVEVMLAARIIEIAEEGKRYKEHLEATAAWFDCFIATAAYGTPAAEEIDILRQFRDEFLLDNPPGRAFVDFYYQFSPPIADFISEHEALRTVVREGFVDPVVTVVEQTRSWWEE
jgi:hypothetical protein